MNTYLFRVSCKVLYCRNIKGIKNSPCSQKTKSHSTSWQMSMLMNQIYLGQRRLEVPHNGNQVPKAIKSSPPRRWKLCSEFWELKVIFSKKQLLHGNISIDYLTYKFKCIVSSFYIFPSHLYNISKHYFTLYILNESYGACNWFI